MSLVKILVIGNKVTIGHSAVLHGCIIKDLCLIGISGIILENAIIEEKAIVAAGALVVPNFIVPSGKLVAGGPAKIIRDLTQTELDDFENSAQRYKKYSEIANESLKNFNG